MDEEMLINNAKTAAKHAHAPYSKFKVGCAILTKSGKVYTGCNVENASYSLTICAERNAIAAGVASEGKLSLEKVVIYTPTPKPTPPCGACRQVIAEFGTAEIVSVCDGAGVIRSDSGALLPHTFDFNPT